MSNTHRSALTWSIVLMAAAVSCGSEAKAPTADAAADASRDVGPSGGADAGQDAPAAPNPVEEAKARPTPVVLRYMPQFNRQRVHLTRLEVVVDGRDVSAYEGLLMAGRHEVAVHLAFTSQGRGSKTFKQDVVVELAKPQQVLLDAKAAEASTEGNLQDVLLVNVAVLTLEGHYLDEALGTRVSDGSAYVVDGPAPTAPASAARAGNLLTSTIDICVVADGIPRSLAFVKLSSNPEWDAAVADAFSRWRFDAARAAPDGKGFCYLQRTVLKVEQ